ncbi:39S mitochondrial ribosomal protein L46-domain-containing protein [Dactylonectria estremocensis]|uniref:Large ribosomal subunit protein mL46 n=1 Tax=Dactylonectria estremocensis TaxID=1079267 RepID=A0A9P9JI92_9HYPO|nr:39S mitochondrial ribosomal protein L46-domain-containing protein [Dactylonectria estremocensis]
MTASSRGRRAVQAVLSSPRCRTASPNVCARCASSASSLAFSRVPYRLYSSAAAPAPGVALAGSDASPAAVHPATPLPYDVRSGMILTRPPLVTRKLHPFENAFFFYQKRLEERLNTPFITGIYYKPDTARRLDWNLKVQGRQGTVAKELGVYNGKSSQAWDDELRVGDELSSQESIVKALLKDAEARVSDDAEIINPEDVVPVEPPVSRVTEADKKSDVRRLDRQLDRTLYLIVKSEDGWVFPADVIPKDQNLHESAKRTLDEAAGVNMNTWVVGRVPVAHVVTKPVVKADGTVEKRGQKTFFLKGRIMAGQADLEGNRFGYSDYKWLTREELKNELSPEYFHGVHNMMADR